MEFLKPNSISGEIMNVFDEAKEKVIIVSPYCKFGKWYKLVKKIRDLQERNIEIEFYIRDGELEALEQVLELGITPICIPNLHAKMYLNENYGIVTSMNLLLSSEINSIDIGYKTNTKKEYDELLDFYNTYLRKTTKPVHLDYDWRHDLERQLSQKFNRIRIFEDEGALRIKTPANNYDIFLWNNKQQNLLRLSGILSNLEFLYGIDNQDTFNKKGLIFELQEAQRGYSSIWATHSKGFKSRSINYLINEEAEQIVNSIVLFISEVEKIKDFCYINRSELKSKYFEI